MAIKRNLNLEQTLSQLEITIDKLDEEQLSVADSLAAFEIGLKLIRRAQKELQEAEQRVVALIEEGGEPTAKPFVDQSTE
jgi:exodeoxyribonuclease VII small subunit